MIVHALNRGVDKRDIFMDDHDRLRFVYGLYIFNTDAAVDIASLRAKGLTMSFSEERRGNRVVDIHAWCLMGNHYHLLISPRSDGGISVFLRKLNIGYAKYFNERHKRSGTLFQGRTKRIPIQTDAHFLHIFNYVHFNPLDFLPPAKTWREQRIKDFKQAKRHLDTYRWSSFNDYCKGEGFPTVISQDLYGDTYKNYGKKVLEFLRDIDAEAISVKGLE